MMMMWYLLVSLSLDVSAAYLATNAWVRCATTPAGTSAVSVSGQKSGIIIGSFGLLCYVKMLTVMLNIEHAIPIAYNYLLH